MFKSIVKIAAATVLFAGIHSLLASGTAKRKAAALLGDQRRNALYRPFYNVLAVVTFGALMLYGVKLPDRRLYRIRGSFARLMQLIQLYFLLFLLNGARQIGFLNFAGLPNIAFWLRGRSPVPLEPEAQGPALGDDGRMKIAGPFRFTRHPLNFGMLPILWLMPKMTVNLAVFNLMTTLYLIVGSVHEEKRLKESYGRAYEDYRESGISFFVPSASYLLSRRKKELTPAASNEIAGENFDSQ